ncbi:dUTP pyrophosphatase [Cribrihabitans marinus]|uniref:Deoxyuridine 5'-triphosphate nucleotidohydrolase n=1 Tax=Cribrihabitans marinus TaxID=1227549 RepID=A0A1H7CKD9_9RHOB|nr:dUTP diphosphatase [Cribrihabitans marinus]GGH35705.1 deoxyuridine 5'-triphosphate nucleotidohydrolase [Cribrihabitans marinus]SEJ89714.1 dUTP pyrophosphatase [Cribrihabitans marinus]
MVTIRVIREAGADPSVPLPSYESAGAAGADVRASFPDRGAIMLEPGARALVPTGLRVEIPEGHEIQVRPRSGLALKYGITLVNTPGTIDSDYRGPLGVIVLNAGHESFEISHGDRIAQLVVAPVVRAAFEETSELDGTTRGSDGFGSTGRG